MNVWHINQFYYDCISRDFTISVLFGPSAQLHSHTKLTVYRNYWQKTNKSREIPDHYCVSTQCFNWQKLVTLISAIWYVHISNCDYVLSWQFLCEMFSCLQTHIKNRLFVRQYQVQCIIYWIFFSSLSCTFKSVFHGISNLIFSFMFTYLFVHIEFFYPVCCLFLLVSYIYFFLVCIVVASVVVFVIFPLILMVSWSVHLMVSWHKFTCLYTKVWAYFCFACLLVFLLVRCISVVFASKHYAHHSIR